jgi:sugar lactone lactonase YvrE
MALFAELISDLKLNLAEGVFWHPEERKIYLIDIYEKKVYTINPINNEIRFFKSPEYIGCIVPERKGTILLALENGIARLDTEKKIINYILEIEKDKEYNRFNDGKCDPSGKFWMGSMCRKGVSQTGSLYSIDSTFNYQKKIKNITISNGITWSLNHKIMYYIDSATRQVVAYNYDIKSGNICKPKISVNIPKKMGIPDGMTIDNQGMLWIALWGGYAVTKWNPKTGKLLEKVSLPVPNVTSCAFGGENMNKLYITTAREGLSEEELIKYPLSGGLFCINLDIGGPEVFFFN